MLTHLHSSVLYLLLGSSHALSQTVQWLTRPGQFTVPLTVVTNNLPATEAKEYLFLCPFDFGGPWYGPHMFDASGQLVWFGGDITQNEAFDLHVTQYKTGTNETHLLFTDGVGTNYLTGVNRFINSSYQQVAQYASRRALPGPDLHEANVVSNVPGPSNSFVYDSYKIVTANLSDFNGPSQGYIISGCFQDVDLVTKKLVFQWCSGPNVPLNQSYIFPGATAGGGYQGSPWDYFHINAIDKTPQGDYVVSSRNTNAIYKIAGRNSHNPGSIIWHLGGRSNSFKMVPSSFNFTFQHHIRYHGTTGNTSTYSLFDNGSDGSDQVSAPASSGMLFTVNEVTMTATLIRQYIQPQYQTAGAMGSMQIMDNGNVFIGWGQVPYISEQTQNGTVLFYAHVGPPGLDAFSYRSFKAPWVGKPAAPPDILAYQQTCNTTSKTFVYVSWNGATEVATYSLSFASSANGTFTPHGAKVPRNGYETAIPALLSQFSPYAKVTAYDASGKVLGTSAPGAVFVPQPGNSQCTARSCGFGFDYSAGNSIASTCGKA